MEIKNIKLVSKRISKYIDLHVNFKLYNIRILSEIKLRCIFDNLLFLGEVYSPNNTWFKRVINK